MAYLTQEQAIARLKAKRGDTYDYSKVVYTRSSEKIEIICEKHGSFWQTFGGHCSGDNCPKCNGRKSRYSSLDEIIKAFKIKHGDTYDYSKAEALKLRDKFTITCRIHGDFEQRGSNHIRGDGCPNCASHKYIDTQVKIRKFRVVHGDKYDYSKFKYINAITPAIIICPHHGEFKQTIANHEKGSGCPFCHRIFFGHKRKTQEQVIEQFIKVHGYKYDYSLVVYKKKTEKVKIICRTHGVFEQLAREHARGSGCRECTFRGWSRTKFVKLCGKHNRGDGLLYLIKILGDGEEFYKIGITSMSVFERFRGSRIKPYSFNVVKEAKLAGDVIYDLENQLKFLMKEYAYTPKHKFKGYTECFSYIPPEVLRLLGGFENSGQLQLIA